MTCLVSSKYAVYKKLISCPWLLFLHIFDACKAFSLLLNTATSFQNSLDKLLYIQEFSVLQLSQLTQIVIRQQTLSHLLYPTDLAKS